MQNYPVTGSLPLDVSGLALSRVLRPSLDSRQRLHLAAAKSGWTWSLIHVYGVPPAALSGEWRDGEKVAPRLVGSGVTQGCHSGHCPNTCRIHLSPLTVMSATIVSCASDHPAQWG